MIPADITPPCAEAPEMWFSESTSKALTPEQIEAKTVCGTCPFQMPCLKAALDNDERWGVWGGLTPAERKQIRIEPPKPKVRQRQGCGTSAGYHAHRRRGEEACRPCKDGETVAARNRAANRAGAA